MPSRLEIIEKIGKDYFTSNLEEITEFSYIQAGIDLKDIPKNEQGKQNYQLDIRFEDKINHLSVLVETVNKHPSKNDIILHEKKLLEGYCLLETRINPQNNIILILSRCDNDDIKVWKKEIRHDIEALPDTVIKTIKDYVKYFETVYINDEIKIKTSVLELNELLHKNSISEDIRGQFVGTCLLALKDKNFRYKEKETDIPFETSIIIQGIRDVIKKLLKDEDLNKAQKIVLLDTNILNNQKVRNLKKEKFKAILDFVSANILPYIDANTSQGQDLLNLFFTTFNKYAYKKDKNQAFTPDHITHFMCKVAEVNKNSKVLDPTCGSGSFIVQALIQELNECNTDAEKDKVKKNNIFGIEIEERAFGLSTTNMLIHLDGNSNVRLEEYKGCFALRDWIQENEIDIVLMNPPYNAKPNEIPECIKDQSNKEIYRIHNWNKKQKDAKDEPTKGFCFVNYIADCIGKNKNGEIRKGAKLLCLLPLACAIGSSEILQNEKKRILENNTLDAVFTLPADMFHPGASANACCMVFNVGTPHFTKATDSEGKEVYVPRKETFFGYFKDDGFIKKKNLGRISKIDENGKSLWHDIEQKWLDLYYGNKTDKYMAIKRKVTGEDEWLAEAYIETDFSKLTETDFEKSVREFFAFSVKEGKI